MELARKSRVCILDFDQGAPNIFKITKLPLPRKLFPKKHDKLLCFSQSYSVVGFMMDCCMIQIVVL